VTTKLDIIPIAYDTREQQPWLLIKPDYADVEMVRKKLDCGDYCLVGAEDLMALEKKRSLDELARCCAQDRARFERELQRMCDAGYRWKWLITQGGRYIDICEGNYRSRLNPLSFTQTLTKWEDRYGLRLRFVDTDTEALKLVYSIMRYVQRELRMERAERSGG